MGQFSGSMGSRSNCQKRKHRMLVWGMVMFWIWEFCEYMVSLFCVKFYGKPLFFSSIIGLNRVILPVSILFHRFQVPSNEKTGTWNLHSQGRYFLDGEFIFATTPIIWRFPKMRVPKSSKIRPLVLKLFLGGDSPFYILGTLHII